MKTRINRWLLVFAILLGVQLSCSNSRFLFLFDNANDQQNTVVAQMEFSPTPTKTTPRASLTPKSNLTPSKTVRISTITATRAPASATAKAPSATPRVPTLKATATLLGSFTARGQFQVTPDMLCKDWTCTISYNSLEMTVRHTEGIVTGRGTIKMLGDRAGCPAVETTMTFDFTNTAYSANWFNGSVNVTVNRAFPKDHCSSLTNLSVPFPWEATQNNGKITGKLIGSNNIPLPFTLNRVP